MSTVLACQFVYNPLHLQSMSFEKMIGQKIRSIRRSKCPDMSMEKLAEMAGLSRQAISNIEHGLGKKVALINITKIAKALSVTVDDIIGRNYLMQEQIAEDPEEYKDPRGVVKKNVNPINEGESEGLLRRGNKRR